MGTYTAVYSAIVDCRLSMQGLVLLGPLGLILGLVLLRLVLIGLLLLATPPPVETPVLSLVRRQSQTAVARPP